MIVILLNMTTQLNMTTMAMEHHDEPQQLTVVLNFINQLFIAVFALECVMKLSQWVAATVSPRLCRGVRHETVSVGCSDCFTSSLTWSAS